MRNKIIVLLSASLIIIPSLIYAQLDLEQEVLIIPETHDAAPYKWNKKLFTWGYNVRLEYGTLIAGNDSEFTSIIKAKKPIHNVHVFITDEDLNVFKHLQPEIKNGKYKFIFNAPSQGKYRFEFVFQTDDGTWLNLRENISVKEGVKAQAPSEQHKDYSVNVKLVPDKVYAEHVVTLIYQISYSGAPVKYLDKIEGADILIASWDKSRREFIYRTSTQNVNGQIAASIVFMKSGRHRVFAEFMHNGAVNVVETDIDVLEEPPQKEHGTFFKDEKPYK